MLKLLNIGLVLTPFLLGLQPGCGGTIGGNPGRSGSGVQFAITDAPVDEVQNVFIKIVSLAVRQEAGDWLEIPVINPDEIDILDLQRGKSETFAALESLPFGTYTELRLALDEDNSARVVDMQNESHPLKVPSGSQSGLKIKSNFEVREGELTRLVLDFDLRKSLKEVGSGQGNSGERFQLKPVIRLVEQAFQGSIHGLGEKGWLVCAYDPSVLTREEECTDGVTSYRIQDGDFVLSFLTSGIYDIVVYDGGSLVGEKKSIEVRAMETTELGRLP